MNTVSNEHLSEAIEREIIYSCRRLKRMNTVSNEHLSEAIEREKYVFILLSLIIGKKLLMNALSIQISTLHFYLQNTIRWHLH
jgi:hypothetical protein